MSASLLGVVKHTHSSINCSTTLNSRIRILIPFMDYLLKVSPSHYCEVIMGEMASQITSLTNVYSAVYSGADQRKHQSSPSLACARGIHRWPVNSPHKWPVMRKMFPLDDLIIEIALWNQLIHFNLHLCLVPGVILLSKPITNNNCVPFVTILLSECFAFGSSSAHFRKNISMAYCKIAVSPVR